MVKQLHLFLLLFCTIAATLGQQNSNANQEPGVKNIKTIITNNDKTFGILTDVQIDNKINKNGINTDPNVALEILRLLRPPYVIYPTYPPFYGGGYDGYGGRGMMMMPPPQT